MKYRQDCRLRPRAIENGSPPTSTGSTSRSAQQPVAPGTARFEEISRWPKTPSSHSSSAFVRRETSRRRTSRRARRRPRVTAGRRHAAAKPDEAHSVEARFQRGESDRARLSLVVPRLTIDVVAVRPRRRRSHDAARKNPAPRSRSGAAPLRGGSRMWTGYNRRSPRSGSQLNSAREQRRRRQLELARARGRLNDSTPGKIARCRRPRTGPVAVPRLARGAAKAGLTVEEFQPEPAAYARHRATRPSGTPITAHGPLNRSPIFLHDYYRSPLLQQITRLQLRPRPIPHSSTISLQTEARLAGHRNETDIAEGDAERAAEESAATDYATSIGRNVFTVYRRRDPVAAAHRRARPRRRQSSTTRSSPTSPRTIQVDGRYQAWIHVRTTNETLRLFEGDAVKVG